MNKKLYMFSQFVVSGLIMIGIMVLGITAHEFKHYIDLEGDVDEFCVLNIPTELSLDSKAGYVIGDGESKELPAYVIMFLTMLFLMFMVHVYAKGWEEQE